MCSLLSPRDLAQHVNPLSSSEERDTQETPNLVWPTAREAFAFEVDLSSSKRLP